MQLNRTATAPRRQEFFLNPSGLDLRDVLPIGMRKDLEAARRLVHVLGVGGLRRGRADRWVPISQEDGVFLVGGRKAWDRLRSALGRDVLECDGHYVIGEKSLHYRLRRRPGPAPLVPSRTKDPLEEGEIAWAFRERRRRSARPRLPVHDRLEGWMRRFSLDAGMAADALAAIEGPERRRYAERVMSIVGGGGEYGRHATVCAFGHRFHSIVTRMPRALRRAIRVDGEPLVEIDVASSQPLLVGLLAAAGVREREGEKAKAKAKGGGEAGGGAGGRLSSITWYVFAPMCHPGCMLPPDLSEYIALCRSGAFYEHLADILALPCRSAVERGLVKTEACRLIFGRHRPGSARWRAFVGRWPTVAAHLAELKEGGHRNVARVLQRAEAAIMIAGACGELTARYPTLPILTVHDSVMVPEYGVAMAVDAIHRAWELRVGGRPKLKVVRPA
jgi:hypothetical protein